MSSLRARGRLGARNPLKQRQPINPMESIVNMIDIMLIFACGLMVSIVMLWGLDMNNERAQDDGGYQSLGQTYQDPETGKLYIVVPAEELGAQAGTKEEAGGGGTVPGANGEPGAGGATAPTAQGATTDSGE